MVTFLQSLPSFSFSSTVPNLIVDSNGKVVEIIVKTRSSVGDWRVVLDEKYSGKADGTVELTALSDIADILTRTTRRIEMSVTAIIDGETANTTGIVLRGNVDVDTPANDWLQNHFLTTLTGVKVTAPGRKELLHAFTPEREGTVTATVLVHGEVTSRSDNIVASEVKDGIAVFNVGSDVVASLLDIPVDTIVEYTFTLQSRSQTFRVLKDEVAPSAALQFVNSFGCIEYLYCAATRTAKTDITRSSMRTSGRLRNYRLQENKTFSLLSGHLTDGMVEWAQEVLRSLQVFLCMEGRVWREVVITDSKSEISNADDEWAAIELSYAYSQKQHNILYGTGSDSGIFDETFDETFE